MQKIEKKMSREHNKNQGACKLMVPFQEIQDD